MADIYQYASITLSATASSGDSHGCYAEISEAAEDLEIILPDDVGACRIAVRRPLKHWDKLIPTQLKRKFPLLSRGWAFQERMLSPRVLHFCESELVWECRQLSVCECAGLGQDSSPRGTFYHAIQDSEEENRAFEIAQRERLDQIMAMQLQQQEDDLQLSMLLQNEEIDPEDIEASFWAAVPPPGDPPDPPPYAGPSNNQHVSVLPTYGQAVPSDIETKERPQLVPHFHRIVEQYSALGLTKQTDRLPALSGLCKRVQHLRGDYLAGLWSDSLCFDLMWRVNTLSLDSSHSGRSMQYRGPSWSWISAQSPVSYWSDIVDFKDPSSIRTARTIQRSRDWWANLEDMEEIMKPTKTTPLGRNTGALRVEINLPGHNPFGAVTSAVLTATASCTTGKLLYTYDNWWGQTRQLDPMRYKLQIQGGARDQVELPFYADYALALDGPQKVAEDEELTLLLVHPKVSLVLKRKVDAQGRVVSLADEAVWERVGIVRISEDLLNYYRIDWMRSSSVETFRIV